MLPSSQKGDDVILACNEIWGKALKRIVGASDSKENPWRKPKDDAEEREPDVRLQRRTQKGETCDAIGSCGMYTR